eukprot:scaffold225319_cov31-Tisochrysis_lutea.AAC.1
MKAQQEHCVHRIAKELCSPGLVRASVQPLVPEFRVGRHGVNDHGRIEVAISACGDARACGASDERRPALLAASSPACNITSHLAHLVLRERLDRLTLRLELAASCLTDAAVNRLPVDEAPVHGLLIADERVIRGRDQAARRRALERAAPQPHHQRPRSARDRRAAHRARAAQMEGILFRVFEFS